MNTPSTHKASNMALEFDAEKVGDNQIRSGRKFTLKVQPGEAPEAFINAELGSRWKVVVVRLGENDEALPPKQPEDKKERRQMWDLPPAQQAALLCDRVDFQSFLQEKSGKIVHDKDTAKLAIYELFSVESRRDLAGPAWPKWKALMNEYRDLVETQRYGEYER